MALVFTQKHRCSLGGRAFRAYEITCDASTTTIDATDLDLKEIENVWMASKNDLSAVATLDFAECSDAVGATSQVTVTGAAIGDYVMVAHEADLVDMNVTAYVQTTDKVDIRVQNESGAAVDLAAGAWYVKILKRVGIETQTGSYITFWPALADGDKFTIWALGYN